MPLFRTLWNEAVLTARRPRRILAALNPRRLWGWLRVLRMEARIGDRWEGKGDEPLRRRAYASYDEYLAHQRSKLESLDLSEYDAKYSAALAQRLARRRESFQGKAALCLAARIGTEVKAFRSLGAFAVGIDLNPGKDNALVLPGDFHRLQFADASADAAFSNSLDHAYELERMLGEVRRVLKPGGVFIVEAPAGSGDGKPPGFFESLWWDKVDDLVRRVVACGFRAEEREAFDYPWAGEQVLFRKLPNRFEEIVARIEETISTKDIRREQKVARLQELAYQFWDLVFPERGTPAYHSLTEDERQKRWAKLPSGLKRSFEIDYVLDFPASGGDFHWLQ